MATVTIGPPVRNQDFFDRLMLVDDIWTAMQSGSLLLAAPRRAGKTSIMLRLRDYPRDGYAGRVFYIDTEALSSPEEFLTELIAHAASALPIPGRIRAYLSSLVSNFDELQLWQFKAKVVGGLHGRWKSKGIDLIQELLASGSKCLLLIDELPIMLNRMAQTDEGTSEAVELLHWLRGLRQEFSGSLSMVLGSSLGISKIASELQSTRTINDLRQMEVGPFDHDTARSFTQELMNSEHLPSDSEVAETLLGQVGTYNPMFIQIMVAAVAQEVKSQGKNVTTEMVQLCYEERVHGPEFRHQFEDYYERLDRYYTQVESRGAKCILRELACVEEGITSSTLYNVYSKELQRSASTENFDRLLTALHDDFYVVISAVDMKVQFHNKWLRDWWRRYHALST